MTKKKTKKTSKNMESTSKKQRPFFGTHSFKSNLTKETTQKKGLSPLAEALLVENSSSSTATERMAKNKSSELYLQDISHQKKENSLLGYDFEAMPELSDEQLKSFRQVSTEEYETFLKVKEVRVLKNANFLELKKLGRPKKSPEDKEKIKKESWQ